MLGKDLQEGNGISGELGRVEAEAGAERRPQDPGSGGGLDALGGDPGVGRRRLNSDPIREELVAGFRVGMIQGKACGY